MIMDVWFLMDSCEVKLTCNPLHPGCLIDAQVVVEDLEDVAQNEAEVLRGDGGAADAASAGCLVLRPPLPPVGQIVTQHGQHHLDDVGHLCIPRS